MASWCDFRVISDRTKFGQPEVSLGLIPGWGGTQILSKIVGPQNSRWMITTGEAIDAEHAIRIGLADKIFPSTEYEAGLMEFVTKLSNSSPLSVKATKKLVISRPEQVRLDVEAEEFAKLFETDDFHEGVAAFRDKRKPSFRGG